MSEELFDRGMNGLEAELASLTWRSSGIDRDRMLYLAGQASVAKPQRPAASLRRWFWPIATAASTLMAVVLGTMLVGAVNSPQIEQIVDVREKRPPRPDVKDNLPFSTPSALERVQAATRVPQTEYLALRELVLEQGLDAWHVAEGSGASEDDTLTSGDVYRASFH